MITGKKMKMHGRLGEAEIGRKQRVKEEGEEIKGNALLKGTGENHLKITEGVLGSMGRVNRWKTSEEDPDFVFAKGGLRHKSN
ncbi:hypothetical protein VNO77_23979 [Canavalia gladiata]|uniref:Uncharacterized protein n=1 Tax=Canavalia gladiata TaxID=3824 RepID=A0AAN9L8T2_CANGL